MTTHFIEIPSPRPEAVVDDIPKLTLEWHIQDRTVTFKNPATKEKESKAILSDVHGIAAPGQFVAIMGPSGAGKSSLLDILSGRVKDFNGSVLVNGQKWDRRMTQCTCYVIQDDLFYHTLTVKEHLLYQADLRMAPSTTLAQREARVHAVMEQLGLLKCQDSFIGNASNRGISGGERKRLSLATELLTNPSILFVDEPTSGLDSFMAESVVHELQKLANEGRTVIATIHQPSSQIFAMFDMLYLLTNGRTIYYGKANQTVDYFKAKGLNCPSYMNPSDYFMREIIIADPSSTEKVGHLLDAWKNQEALQSEVSTEKLSDIVPMTDGANLHIGLMMQLKVLCQRNIRRLLRDKMAFRARFGQSIVIALLAGLIYLRLDMSQSAIQSYLGALFFITLNQGMLAANSEFVLIPLELPIMLREYEAGLYGSTMWYIAKNISELLVQFFFPMVFLLPLYYLIGFGRFSNDSTDLFFTFYLILSLVTSASVGIGYMVSCAVRRADLAPMIGIVTLMPFVLFGGLLVNTDDTPVYFIWLEYLSPIKYGYRALNRAFWTTIPSIPCAAGQRCAAVNGLQVLENASLNEHSLLYDSLLLIAINIGFRFLGLIALLFTVHKKK
ncbi:ATP-binding Cassette (ABC) Superfamily [Thraustotheca clavata]|uniref:ATP-binding Cassette (ABC) Superfamily n=1 Tax=Thraustotheca clavata TaxID=74557 RepID=A0A1V9ZF74_9STRA|nr:ATP-binding Cassette (ABC) Superfamily [Thraustotheca clavata]